MLKEIILLSSKLREVLLVGFLQQSSNLLMMKCSLESSNKYNGLISTKWQNNSALSKLLDRTAINIVCKHNLLQRNLFSNLPNNWFRLDRKECVHSFLNVVNHPACRPTVLTFCVDIQDSGLSHEFSVDYDIPKPLKCFSQSLSFICCLRGDKNVVPPGVEDVWSSTVTSLESFVMVRMRRLEQRRASSRASIQHLPDRGGNMGDNISARNTLIQNTHTNTQIHAYTEKLTLIYRHTHILNTNMHTHTHTHPIYLPAASEGARKIT